MPAAAAAADPGRAAATGDLLHRSGLAVGQQSAGRPLDLGLLPPSGLSAAAGRSGPERTGCAAAVDHGSDALDGTMADQLDSASGRTAAAVSAPRAHMVYAVPPQHLLRQNGTSQRLHSLRLALQQHYQLRETNLLAAPLRLRERLSMALISLLSLSNNLRYLALRHRLPARRPGDLMVLVGPYCACLALGAADGPLAVDLIDSLTLTDIRGVQSRWRWRPLLYACQLPSSWLLERLLLGHNRLNAVLVTTEREQAWLERVHGRHGRLHALPNHVATPPLLDPTPELTASTPLQLAFVGALSWWVNRLNAQNAVRILNTFLQGPGAGRSIVFNLYGSGQPARWPGAHLPQLQIRLHGYCDDLREVARSNHAAFLPNPIGRGFQNKLLSCVGMGMPTIAGATMNPHRQPDEAPSPVMYCRHQADYEHALLSLWQLSDAQRGQIAARSRAYVQAHYSADRIAQLLAAALD